MAGQDYNELLEAVRTVDRIHSLGDAVYQVRERELQGWDGPLVTEYGNAVATINKHLKGET
ncbi:MAG: hypothetical protein AB7V08_13750 [Elusimicrobiales bacterium]